MSLIVELRKLQDKVKPFDTHGIRALVEAELGRKVEDVFLEFHEEPLAAASIAQVHRGTLKDGRRVVLKIQRPNLQRIIETDLTLLHWLAELAEERLPEVRRYHPVGLVDEFHHSIIKEIDFQTEAYHMQRFARDFADDPDIYVPKVMEEYTTSRILCEEFIEGLKLNDPSLHERQDIDTVKIAKTGIRLVVQQALVNGFFHADPHPGNIFILPPDRICFIDYGMMGTLDQQRIDELLTFFVAIFTRDLDKLLHLFHRLDLVGEEVDVRGLRRDVDDLICRFQTQELAKIDVGRFIQQVFEVVIRHEVQVPSDLLLVGKALATIEGVGRDLYPDLSPVEEIRPFILKVYLDRLTQPSFYSRVPRRVAQEAMFLLEGFPRDFRLMLRKLRRGELKINLDHNEYAASTRAHAQAINRLGLSLLICTVGMASLFLLVRTDLSFLIGDFPLGALLGAAGLALASFLGMVLLVGYVRSGGA